MYFYVQEHLLGMAFVLSATEELLFSYGEPASTTSYLLASFGWRMGCTGLESTSA